jgi:hypothetical protein
LSHLNHFHVDRFPKLSACKKQFLSKIVPIARHISKSISSHVWREGARVSSKHGLFSSVIAAACIVISKWGTSILSQDRILETRKCERSDGKSYQNSISGNNLLHLPADERWRTYYDTIGYRRRLFKSFLDLSAFQIEVIDMFAWRDRSQYSKILDAKSIKAQVREFAKLYRNPARVERNMLRVIHVFKLKELDV